MAEKFAVSRMIIQEMINDGATVEQISEFYSSTEELVSEFIERHGIFMQRQVPKRDDNCTCENYLSSITKPARKALHGKWGK